MTTMLISRVDNLKFVPLTYSKASLRVCRTEEKIIFIRFELFCLSQRNVPHEYYSCVLSAKRTELLQLLDQRLIRTLILECKMKSVQLYFCEIESVMN